MVLKIILVKRPTSIKKQLNQKLWTTGTGYKTMFLFSFWNIYFPITIHKNGTELNNSYTYKYTMLRELFENIACYLN